VWPDGAERPIPPLLSISEILRRMEASPVRYQLRPFEDCEIPPERTAALLWPRGTPEFAFPVVTSDIDGSPIVHELSHLPEIDTLLLQAEPAYLDQRFQEATALYDRALALAPGYGPALLNAGDARLFGGQPLEALDLYRRAQLADPFDHRGYFYAANTLLMLGRPDEALRGYAEALARRPRHSLLRAGIEARGKYLGRRLRGDVLQFEGFIRRGSEAIEICATSTPAWIAWASCKGYWLGDATHRRQMLGTETPVFSNVEELECLRALLQGYERQRGEQPDASLEELRDISLAGELDVLVLLELATRVDPHAALRVPARVRPRLVRYVLRHLLVEGEGPRLLPPGQGPGGPLEARFTEEPRSGAARSRLTAADGAPRPRR
jgi:tetratricopeptide (TPR) repeat protein